MSTSLIQAENVSKKFCRTLKRSLWYGIRDIAGELKLFGKTGTPPSAISNPMPPLRTDEFWALKNVSFNLNRGECLGLIGHNGAGKSTLLKILHGLIKPDTGRIVMRGRVGSLIELSAGFNPILTGRENIYNRGALFGFSKKEIDSKFKAIVEFAEIGDFLDMPVQNYSSGMRVRLGFAVSSQMEPDILLVDEVLAVGDVGFRLKCINAMADLMSRSAVIFVSHSMTQILRVCTQILHLQSGTVDYYGNRIPEGIGRYFLKLPAQQPKTGGSGEIVIESLVIETKDQKFTDNIPIIVRHNERVAFSICVRFNGTITHAAAQILFWNEEMIPVLDVLGRNERGFRFTRNGKDTKKVTLTIDHLWLRPGRYQVSVIFTEPDLKKTYAHASNAASLTVTGESPSGAGCIVQGNWQVASC